MYHMPPPPLDAVEKPGRAVGQIERAVPSIGGEDDRAQLPVLDETPCCQTGRHKVLRMRHEQLDTGFLGGGNDGVAIRHRHRHGLFQEDVLAGFTCRYGDLCMQEVGQPNHNDVYLRIR